MSVGPHTQERLSDTQNNTLQGWNSNPSIRLFNTEQIFSINFPLFKAQCEHFVMASSICCVEQMTDLVSVRVSILSWPRRRGGGASLTLDVERKRERLEEGMGRESRDKDGQREETAAAPASPNPPAVSAVYLRRPGGVVVLHSRAAEEETHTGNKRVLNLEDSFVSTSTKMHHSTHKYSLPLQCLSVFLVHSLCHTDTLHIHTYRHISIIVSSFIDMIYYPAIYSNLLLPKLTR